MHARGPEFDSQHLREKKGKKNSSHFCHVTFFQIFQLVPGTDLSFGGFHHHNPGCLTIVVSMGKGLPRAQVFWQWVPSRWCYSETMYNLEEIRTSLEVDPCGGPRGLTPGSTSCTVSLPVLCRRRASASLTGMLLCHSVLRPKLPLQVFGHSDYTVNKTLTETCPLCSLP